MKTFDGNSLFTELHLSFLFLYIYRWTCSKNISNFYFIVRFNKIMEIKIKSFISVYIHKWGTVISNLSMFSFIDVRKKEKKKKNFES